jgi:hypothetical protein
MLLLLSCIHICVGNAVVVVVAAVDAAVILA